jgi:hypothetical protein
MSSRLATAVKAQSLNNRRVVSSALGPLTSVALPDALPCRSVLQMDLPVGTGQDLQLHRRSCEPRRSSWDRNLCVQNTRRSLAP